MIGRIACIGMALILIRSSLATSQEATQADWHAPPIEDCISVRNGMTGAPISLSAMMGELAEADAVFLGETHDDDTTHRVELMILDELLSRRESRVVLALEMFERDVQPQLDEYLSGKLSESEFLKQSRPWGNYREAYRPLVEAAKAAGAPVVASNFPRPIRMKMASEGEAALKSPDLDPRLVPREFLPNSELYWKRTDNAIRGHIGMMPSSTDSNRLFSTQSLWDNSMGESCAWALEQHPGFSVVHVNGGFHSSYWDGTAGQLAKRKPEARIKTVAIVPAPSPTSWRQVGAPQADFVVVAEQRATNLNDERRSVYVNRRNEYQLVIPPDATPESPAPLLIWLGADGLSSEEGLKFWRAAIGDGAAIAVLEPPYRERQHDLSLGGRWYWGDSFSDDIAAMVEAVERTTSYALERYPIDPNRVCLAGEGAGATVVAAATLLTNSMTVHSVAIRPRLYTKIKDIPLPLLEDWGAAKPPTRSLQVISAPTDKEWWEKELNEYRTVGLSTEWTAEAADPWSRFMQTEQAICGALQIQQPRSPEIKSRAYVLVDSDSPLHLSWARIAAQEASEGGALCVAVTDPREAESATPTNFEISPQSLSSGDSIPQCPGPFGGTTILVLNKGVGEADLKAWLELEKSDPLNKKSRFHRLRIATTADGDHSLGRQMQTLIEQNRTNFLIVPVAFYAGESWMRELERQTVDFSDRSTVHWLPGLGSQNLARPNSAIR